MILSFRKKKFLPIFIQVLLLLAIAFPAFSRNSISMERNIEMRGPMLEYSALQSGTATASIDLCTAPGTLEGTGNALFEGEGYRSSVQLQEQGTGVIRVAGWVSCATNPTVTAQWNERWHSTQTARWPGGGRKFESNWQDTFPLRFELGTGPATIRSDQLVTYPRSPVDTTTSMTEFETNLCVTLCDPAKVEEEFTEHLVRAFGWKRSLFEIDLHPTTGMSLTELRQEIEAWIDASTPRYDTDTGEVFAPSPDMVSEPVEGNGTAESASFSGTPETDEISSPDGALANRRGADDGAGALARALRVNPATCAIEQRKNGEEWIEAAFPMTQDCILQSVATERMLNEKSRCLAVRGCSINADSPLAGKGINCLEPDAYTEILRSDISILQIRQMDAHCESAEKLLWWLEQHAACHSTRYDPVDLHRRMDQACSDTTSTDQQKDTWPGSVTCKESCEARFSDEWDLAICMLECREGLMEEMRNQRQQANDAFSDFNKKANELFNLLGSVIKEEEEMQSGIIRNMLD